MDTENGKNVRKMLSVVKHVNSNKGSCTDNIHKVALTYTVKLRDGVPIYKNGSSLDQRCKQRSTMPIFYHTIEIILIKMYCCCNMLSQIFITLIKRVLKLKMFNHSV